MPLNILCLNRQVENNYNFASHLPQCKPEQVQVVRENEDPPSTPGGKRDRLQYKVGDVITVLDKR